MLFGLHGSLFRLSNYFKELCKDYKIIRGFVTNSTPSESSIAGYNFSISLPRKEEK